MSQGRSKDIQPDSAAGVVAPNIVVENPAAAFGAISILSFGPLTFARTRDMDNETYPE
jgi:hypothetical protein